MALLVFPLIHGPSLLLVAMDRLVRILNDVARPPLTPFLLELLLLAPVQTGLPECRLEWGVSSHALHPVVIVTTGLVRTVDDAPLAVGSSFVAQSPLTQFLLEPLLLAPVETGLLVCSMAWGVLSGVFLSSSKRSETNTRRSETKSRRWALNLWSKKRRFYIAC